VFGFVKFFFKKKAVSSLGLKGFRPLGARIAVAPWDFPKVRKINLLSGGK
jgi:hypothetical protein